MKTSILFGKKFDADRLAQKVISQIVTWPRTKSVLTDRLGNYAQVVRWKTRQGKKRKIIEARNHPAVDWLLELIIPALCARDSRPFQLIADAIEAHKTNAFPANQIWSTTYNVARELAGLATPFNEVGEPNAEDEIQRELGLPVNELPEIICVPVTESVLRRKVEKRFGFEINPGTFTRILKSCSIRCHQEANSGGRGRRVLQSRGRKQKPNR
jgi:hypothetical protein